MQSLLNSLKTLILSVDPTLIINNRFGPLSKSMDKEIDGHLFVHQLQQFCSKLTIDQCIGINKMLQDKWMRAPRAINTLSYSTETSIFNVLLHFTTQTLTCHDGMVKVNVDKILPWHMLSVQIGEDVLACAHMAASDKVSNNNREDFTWQPFLNVDDDLLRQLLDRPLCDVHNHLKGSSLNFDLSWMCLMNHISSRGDNFEKLKIKQYPTIILTDNEGVQSTWYSLVIKAAAIRWYLFLVSRRLERPKDYSFMVDVLMSSTEMECRMLSNKLQTKIYAVLTLYGKNYGDSFDCTPDYAIDKNQVGLFSVLSGERLLLYKLFKVIYDTTKEADLLGTLLYTYLCIKAQFRQELIQTNNSIGFANFSLYENRKEVFTDGYDCYNDLIPQMAVGELLKSKSNRYMETRITPKITVPELIDQIIKTDMSIDNIVIDKEAAKWSDNCDYVYHFIKKEDKDLEVNELQYRHYKLRREVELQARAIFNLRNSDVLDLSNPLHNRIVGVDAANSEIYARPEVFAQAFRYLRMPIANELTFTSPISLRETYHVGEDFWDVIDGLRAVDEVCTFMQLRKGDRLGHALVLGIDVTRYYTNRDNVIPMPLHTILDNIVWMIVKGSRKIEKKVLDSLQYKYKDIYKRVYDDAPPLVQSYYNSWLLRGDNPIAYSSNGVNKSNGDSSDYWNQYSFVMSDEVNHARKDRIAVSLYNRYHYDMNVKKRGSKIEEFRVDTSYLRTIKYLQKMMLKKVKHIGLCIECNPTSNFRIGEIERYDQHPILQFFNIGIKTSYKKNYMSVSINTDDKGVFSTSLEREYALMAAALKKNNEHNNSKEAIANWLDTIRQMGWGHCFNQNRFPPKEIGRCVAGERIKHLCHVLNH